MTIDPKRRASLRARRVLSITLLAVFLACDGMSTESEFEMTTYAELVEESPVRPRAFSAQLTATLSDQTSDFSPRLMRNGTARIEVQNLDLSLASAQELASAVEGFVAGSELLEGREGERTASLVLRVPADSFQSVLGRLPELGRVLSLELVAEDVSREYVDIETRLGVGEETVARLRELASRGGNLEDMLAAERELGRALTELESLKGQLRFYDQRVAESDLRITLVEPGAVIAPGAFRPVVEAFREATETFAQSVASVIRFAVMVAPWLLLTAMSWIGLTRRLGKRRARVRPSAL
jgi:hypothetical protein